MMIKERLTIKFIKIKILGLKDNIEDEVDPDEYTLLIDGIE